MDASLLLLTASDLDAYRQSVYLFNSKLQLLNTAINNMPEEIAGVPVGHIKSAFLTFYQLMLQASPGGSDDIYEYEQAFEQFAEPVTGIPWLLDLGLSVLFEPYDWISSAYSFFTEGNLLALASFLPFLTGIGRWSDELGDFGKYMDEIEDFQHIDYEALGKITDVFKGIDRANELNLLNNLANLPLESRRRIFQFASQIGDNAWSTLAKLPPENNRLILELASQMGGVNDNVVQLLAGLDLDQLQSLGRSAEYSHQARSVYADIWENFWDPSTMGARLGSQSPDAPPPVTVAVSKTSDNKTVMSVSVGPSIELDASRRMVEYLKQQYPDAIVLPKRSAIGDTWQQMETYWTPQRYVDLEGPLEGPSLPAAPWHAEPNLVMGTSGQMSEIRISNILGPCTTCIPFLQGTYIVAHYDAEGKLWFLGLGLPRP